MTVCNEQLQYIAQFKLVTLFCFCMFGDGAQMVINLISEAAAKSFYATASYANGRNSAKRGHSWRHTGWLRHGS